MRICTWQIDLRPNGRPWRLSHDKLVRGRKDDVSTRCGRARRSVTTHRKRRATGRRRRLCFRRSCTTDTGRRPVTFQDVDTSTDDMAGRRAILRRERLHDSSGLDASRHDCRTAGLGDLWTDDGGHGGCGVRRPFSLSHTLSACPPTNR